MELNDGKALHVPAKDLKPEIHSTRDRLLSHTGKADSASGSCISMTPRIVQNVNVAIKKTANGDNETLKKNLSNIAFMFCFFSRSHEVVFQTYQYRGGSQKSNGRTFSRISTPADLTYGVT